MLQDILKAKPYLSWYIKNKDELSDESALEHILGYGDWDDVQELLSILGAKKTATIFRRQIQRRRVNYDPKMINYFKLYFNKYAR